VLSLEILNFDRFFLALIDSSKKSTSKSLSGLITRSSVNCENACVWVKCDMNGYPYDLAFLKERSGWIG
jgi:hypothetical protein